MYTLFLLVTIFLLGAYFLRNQVPIEFVRQHEKQVATATAVATFISGLLLIAQIGGFGHKVGIFIAMLGLLTLIAKQQPDIVPRTLQELESHWNPFTHPLSLQLWGGLFSSWGLLWLFPPAFGLI
jgi:hypothetical protein